MGPDRPKGRSQERLHKRFTGGWRAVAGAVRAVAKRRRGNGGAEAIGALTVIPKGGGGGQNTPFKCGPHRNSGGGGGCPCKCSGGAQSAVLAHRTPMGLCLGQEAVRASCLCPRDVAPEMLPADLPTSDCSPAPPSTNQSMAREYPLYYHGPHPRERLHVRLWTPCRRQGCIRRGGPSEAVRQVVGGGCQSGWGRLLSVTNAIEAGTWRHRDGGWA